MPNIFMTSDHHFGHKNILKFEPHARNFDSIEEHDEYLVQMWNEVVKPKDLVFHLGDLIFPTYAVKYVARLNGRKRLIMGNHDWKKDKIIAPYFERMGGCAYIDRGYVLTHIPMRMEDSGKDPERGKINLHGHLHSRIIEDPRYVNVSIEQNELRPIAFEDIKSELKRRFKKD